MTRTEWLAALQGQDRVTLQDVVVTVQAYMPAPDEIAAYHAFLETLANELRAIVYPEPEPAEPALVPETAPAEEVIHA